MGIYVEGEITVERMLLTLDDDKRRRAVQGMIAAAHKIAKTARDMAPHDFGYLENAIKVSGDEGAQPRDGSGRFKKREIVVYVDGSMPAPEHGPNATVGKYALWAHELLQPTGQRPIGPKSEEKQAGVDVIVGGGYMERALEEHEEKLMFEIAEVVREG